MTSHNHARVYSYEVQRQRAIMLETDLQAWEERMEGLIAQGAWILAFRGAGSANGIEPGAADKISSILQVYVAALTKAGMPIVLMFDGEDDIRERPDVGSVFGTVVDAFAHTPRVVPMVVQASRWYEPKTSGAALASATGVPYETYVFDGNMPAIDPDLRRQRGMAHSALTQSAALVAYSRYEQVIVGPAGSITAAQLRDLAHKAGRRPAEIGPVPVAILTAPINPAVGESLQASLLGGDEVRRLRAAEKIKQRSECPYGRLCTPTGELALDPSSYPRLAFRAVLVQ